MAELIEHWSLCSIFFWIYTEFIKDWCLPIIVIFHAFLFSYFNIHAIIIWHCGTKMYPFVMFLYWINKIFEIYAQNWYKTVVLASSIGSRLNCRFHPLGHWSSDFAGPKQPFYPGFWLYTPHFQNLHPKIDIKQLVSFIPSKVGDTPLSPSGLLL